MESQRAKPRSQAGGSPPTADSPPVSPTREASEDTHGRLTKLHVHPAHQDVREGRRSVAEQPVCGAQLAARDRAGLIAATTIDLPDSTALPTPANVAWLRQHFKIKAHIFARSISPESTSPTSADTVPENFTTSASGAAKDDLFAREPVLRRSYSAPDCRGYTASLKGRSLHFLLSADESLRAAQKKLAVASLLLAGNSERRAGAPADHLAAALKLVAACLGTAHRDRVDRGGQLGDAAKKGGATMQQSEHNADELREQLNFMSNLAGGAPPS